MMTNISGSYFLNMFIIKIIESRKEDINKLKDIFLETRRSTFSWVDTSQFKLSDFEKETEGEYVLVAMIDEKVIGFISVWVADNFIHHLYVDKSFQDQKVGTKLLNAVLDKFGLPVRLKCEIKNQKAVSFYRQKGFVEIEQGHSEMGVYILFELRKKLS